MCTEYASILSFCIGSNFAVGFSFHSYCLFLLLQTLIAHGNYGMRATIVQENGKVVTEGDDMNQHFHLPLDYFEVKNNRPLRLRKKLYEFYTAPITKFWGHSVSNGVALTSCYI